MPYELVLGAAGFIGRHLCKRLSKNGSLVVGVDQNGATDANMFCHEFLQGDLCDAEFVKRIISRYDYATVYQLAANMGGAGYLFTTHNDFDIISKSVQINVNVATALKDAFAGHAKEQKPVVLFASSACVYPEYNQLDPENPQCREDSVLPASPDSCYGWEKLFSEILFDSLHRNVEFEVRIARFHNIFGPKCTFEGGREKAPAAICRKVAAARNGGHIDIWGDGRQTRSFLFIDECLDGIQKLMSSNLTAPINIGSEEMVSINELTEMIIGISGKNLTINHVDGPTGVRGRTSNNDLARLKLQWEPKQPLIHGLEKLYHWIETVMRKDGNDHSCE